MAVLPDRIANVDPNAAADINSLQAQILTAGSAAGTLSNWIVNSNFDINELDTYAVESWASAANIAYGPTNWAIHRTAGALNATMYRVAGSSGPPGAQFYNRLAQDVSDTSNAPIICMQGIETNRISSLWGNNVNFQIKLKKDPSWTPFSVTFGLKYSGSEDATPDSTWNTIDSSVEVVTDDWVTYELEDVEITSAHKTVAVFVEVVPPVGTAGAQYHLDMSQGFLYINLLSGADYKVPDPALEKSICRGYNWVTDRWDNAGSPYDFTWFANGYMASGTQASFLMRYPQYFQLLPTETLTGTFHAYSTGGNAAYTKNGFRTGNTTADLQATGGSIGSGGDMAEFRANTSTTRIQFDGQL